MHLTDLDTLIPLLQKHHLYTRKSFGQHFLINQTVLDGMVKRATIGNEDVVVEIGPGTGVLTRELAARAKTVEAFEIDGSLRQLLAETLAEFANTTVSYGDFLKVDIEALGTRLGDYKVVANLPYNVGSHIINRLISCKQPPTSITVLLQKEVAEKLTASVPDGTYLSHFVSHYGKAELVMPVKASDFMPAPKVDSAVVHIEGQTKGGEEYAADMREWSGFLHKGFSQPRKKLNKVFSLEVLERAGVDPNKRAQHVTTEEWERLFRA